MYNPLCRIQRTHKYFPVAGAQIFENTTDVSSYSYDSSKRELVSYDTPNIIKLKAQYVNTKGLGGSMFWELSTDKVGSGSLIQVSANTLGSLDQTQNHIKYVIKVFRHEIHANRYDHQLS